MKSAARRWLPLIGLGLLALIILAAHATAHDKSRPDLDGWFMSLRNKHTVPCCDGSDAMRLNDVDWESKDGHYRVRLEGEWVDVPDESVIDSPNRAGQTMVWPFYINGGLNGIRCFMPGAMI